jgi:type IV pilus assembly protein PilF
LNICRLFFKNSHKKNNNANIPVNREWKIFVSGATVARKLLSLTLLCLTSSVLVACDPDTHASMQVTYPYLNAARMNAHTALDYLHQGQTGLALEKLHLALQQAPKDPYVLDAMGYFQEKSGAVDIANNYFFKALALDPENGAARNNYGAFLCRNGYTKAAISYYLMAAKTPDYQQAADAYSNARYCAKGLGAEADSAYYTELMKQSPSQSTDTK